MSSIPRCAWTAALAMCAATSWSTMALASDDTSDGQIGSVADGWPIVLDAGSQSMTLEVPPCPPDACPAPGYQVAVKLWMRTVAAPGVTGYQAFVDYDSTKLLYEPTLSTYGTGNCGVQSANDFPLELIPLGLANWAPNKLQFAANVALAFPQVPIVGDSQLVTIVFTVLGAPFCDTTSLGFGTGPGGFLSELSLNGVPLVGTRLVGTGLFTLDTVAPTVFCPPDITTYSELNRTLAGDTDCTVAHAGVGCSDVGCTAIVCTMDPYCCNTLWDGICAIEAVSFCPPDFGPCGGSIVSFNVTATDTCDPMPTIQCTTGGFPISSPTHFPVGITAITCTATDDCGNVSAPCGFLVTVTPENLVSVSITLPTVDPFQCAVFNRCIHFQTNMCAAVADVTLPFTPQACFGANYATFVGDILIPCGTWTSLCAKDRQHTKWDTATLLRTGTTYSASPITLLPGDDDNDGDVDINDVTWLVFQFGGPAKAPTCFPIFPADRDADFGNSGFVGIQDYSAMTPQFLTVSSCACALPELGEPEEFVKDRTWLSIDEIDPAIAADVDLNGDGIFDHTDVRIFEMRNGLPTTLSSKMRAHPNHEPGH
ncbi:MAG: hypothetical protein U0575_03810 [Phycisphaerales bacterium]